MDGNAKKKKTGWVIFLSVLVLLAVCLYSQKQIQEVDSKETLVGTWEYEKSIDENGNEITGDLSNTRLSVYENGTGELSFEELLTKDFRWEYIRQNQEGQYYQIRVVDDSQSAEGGEGKKELVSEAEIVSEGASRDKGLVGRLCVTNEDVPEAMLIFRKISEEPTEFFSLAEAVEDFAEGIENARNSNEDEDHQPTLGEQNALQKAYQYLEYSAFSYTGLIEQLEFEGFSTSEATYAADHCGADWNEQAAKKARQYLEYSAFSRSELIDQLEFEGFTYSQAVYGVGENGY